jgi:hypothetical protein
MNTDDTDTEETRRCGAETRAGEPCKKYPVEGAERCRLHGGRSTGPRDTSALEGNDHAVGNDGGAPDPGANREEHGLEADREAWFDRHRDEVEPAVRTLVESYVESAPFGFEDTAKVDKLTEVAIDQVRLRKSNEYLSGEFLTERVVDVDDTGSPIVELEENPGHLPRDRIKRSNLRALKELGILDGPAATQAAATETLAEVLAESSE